MRIMSVKKATMMTAKASREKSRSFMVEERDGKTGEDPGSAYSAKSGDKILGNIAQQAHGLKTVFETKREQNLRLKMKAEMDD